MASTRPDNDSIDSVENLREFKPILQQQILEKELEFMEKVRTNHESFVALDQSLTQLMEHVESLRSRVDTLSGDLQTSPPAASRAGRSRTSTSCTTRRRRSTTTASRTSTTTRSSATC